MPKSLEKCVNDVKEQGKSEDSAYAICSNSTGYKVGKGSTKHKKKWIKEESFDSFIANVLSSLNGDSSEVTE